MARSRFDETASLESSPRQGRKPDWARTPQGGRARDGPVPGCEGTGEAPMGRVIGGEMRLESLGFGDQPRSNRSRRDSRAWTRSAWWRWIFSTSGSVRESS